MVGLVQTPGTETKCLAREGSHWSAATMLPCPHAAEPDSSWCMRHGRMQAQLFKTYKRLSNSLKELCAAEALPSVEQIVEADDLAQVKEWEQIVVRRLRLVDRTATARSVHHERFYRGGDEGHQAFIRFLKDQSDEIQTTLWAVRQKVYLMSLAQSEAEWIMSVPPVEADPELEASFEQPVSEVVSLPETLTPPSLGPPVDRVDYQLQRIGLDTESEQPGTQAVGLSISVPPQSADLSNSAERIESGAQRREGDEFRLAELEDDDLLDAIIQLRDQDLALPYINLVARLRVYLIPPKDLADTIQPYTWVSVVETIFRRVIVRVPRLATIALDPHPRGPLSSPLRSVRDMLDLLEERLTAPATAEEGRTDVALLWKAMKLVRTPQENRNTGRSQAFRLEAGLGKLSGPEIGKALRETFLAPNMPPNVGTQLLGGKVYESLPRVEMSAEYWDLFYHFIEHFPHVLSSTVTLAAYTRNRRLARLFVYRDWHTKKESREKVALVLARIYLALDNGSTCGPKTETCDGPAPLHQDNVYGCHRKDTWERPYVFLKMIRCDGGLKLIRKWSAARSLQVLYRDVERDGPIMSISSVKDAVWRTQVRYSDDPFQEPTDPWAADEQILPQAWFDEITNQQREAQTFDAAFQDCYHVLILDKRPVPSNLESSTIAFATFFNEIVQLVVRSFGYKDPTEMFTGEVEAMFKGFEWMSCGHANFLGDPPDPEDYHDSYKGNCLAGVDYTLTTRKMFREDVAGF